MHVDHFDTPALVQYIHTNFRNRWFLCSEIDNPEFKKLLLKLCDPRNGAGKDYFRMKCDETTGKRSYQLKGCMITKFIPDDEEFPVLFFNRDLWK